MTAFLRFLWPCLLLGSLAHAEYFSDYVREPVAPPPGKEYGASYLGRYFSGGFDHWLALDFHGRLQRHWALGVGVGGSLAGDAIDGRVSGLWFPSGKLQKNGYEDWLSLSAGSLIRNSPGSRDCFDFDTGVAVSCNEWTTGPWIGLSYGRDIAPMETVGMGFRLSMEVAYVLGSALSRSGTPSMAAGVGTRLGNLMVTFQVGGFLF